MLLLIGTCSELRAEHQHNKFEVDNTIHRIRG